MIAIIVEGASFSSSKDHSLASVVSQTVSCQAIYRFGPHVFRKNKLFDKLLALVLLYGDEQLLLCGKSLGAVRVLDFINKQTRIKDNISVLTVDPYQPFKYKYGCSYTLKRSTVKSVINTYQMVRRPKGAVVIGALNVQQVRVDHMTIAHSEKTRELIKKATEVLNA